MKKKLLASIFTDGVVLQRDYPVKLWGWTQAHSILGIHFLTDFYETRASEDGSWELTLPPMPAGGPYEIEVISEDQQVSLENVLFGDVWICSGQSNMELPMRRVKNAFPQELLDCENLEIRQFTVPLTYDFHEEQDDLPTSEWVAAHPASIHNFSATGYFFAKNLHEQFQVPIGLIMTAVGGTPIEAWMSEEALQPFPQYLETLKKCRDDSYVQAIQQEDEKRSQNWHDSLNHSDLGLSEEWFRPECDDSHWDEIDLCANWMNSPDLRGCGSIWVRLNVIVPETMANKPARIFMGCVVDADYVYVNGKLVGHTGYQYPPREYEIDGLLPGRNVIAVRVIAVHETGRFVKDKPYKLVCEDMEVSLETRWKVKRAVTCPPLASSTFFQYKPTGTYNSMIAPLHSYAMKGVIWYQGESNTGNPTNYCEKFTSMVTNWRQRFEQGDFPFLFVQLANFLPPKPPVYSWAFLREEQRKALALPRTGMAVSIDVGEYNDLHPLNKKAIGDRLANLAASIAYGQQLIASGPLFDFAKIEEDQAILNFTSIGKGLMAKGSHILSGFTLTIEACEIPVQATIKENTVVITSSKLKEANTIQYAWADHPLHANLYNIEGLPASPFQVKI